MKDNEITCPKCKSKEFEIYYNWIRNHQSLEGITPSDKNKWLEIINRGYYGK